MATKYPTALDDSVTLGGPFIDKSPPVDPQRNIGAEFRNNANDADIAVQTRLGILNSIDVTSVDWGLMSVGGDPNQGLRVADTHAEWPGAVGEGGLFIATGTGNISYHEVGDPLATFTDLTGGGVSSWNALYATGTQMDVTSASMVFAGTLGNPIFAVEQAGVGGALKLEKTNATGNYLTANNGASDVYSIGPLGATSQQLVGLTGATTANSRTLTSAGTLVPGSLYAQDVVIDGHTSDVAGTFYYGMRYTYTANGSAVSARAINISGD